MASFEELEARIAALEQRLDAIERPWQCPVCGRDFSSGRALADHIRMAQDHIRKKD